MGLQTKVYSQGSNTFTLELTLVENYTSTSGNSSSVSYTLKLKSTTKNFSQYGVGASVTLDGQTVATRDRYSAPKVTLGTYSEVTLLSGSVTIGHNNDGSKTMSLSYALDMSSASWTPGSINGSGAMTLTKIPREGTLTSAPNFTDEDNPTITFSNPAGLNAYAYMEVTGTGFHPAEPRRVFGSSYTFVLTESERNALRSINTSSNTQAIRFVLRTDIGTTTYYSWLDRTLTIKNPAPTLSPTVKDVNSKTLALTGNAEKLVKYHSNAKVTFGVSAVKGAAIKSKKVTCSTQTLTADGTIQGVESGAFSFSVTDSRSNTTAKTVTKDMVNYVRLSCNMGDGAPDGEGNFALEVTGACFYGSFGAVENTLTVEYRYRVQGEKTWGAWTAVDSVLPLGFTYLARAKVRGLGYQTTYQFQARATDKLETVTTSEKAVKSLPVFDWSGKDFNFNVPVTVQGVQICKNNVLWSGAWWPSDTQKAYFSAPVSKQQTGIVLIFSYYDGGPKDWDFNFQFVPKWFVEMLPGGSFSFGYAHLYNEYFATKALQVFDTYLVGGAHNSSGANGPGANGITTTNNKQVLRYVIGV